MATPLSSMSILQLKRELMDLHDSSFVFTDRDELECALKAARRVELSKKRAGLHERGSSNNNNIASSSSHSAAGSTTVSTAASSALSSMTSALSAPSSRRESSAGSEASSSAPSWCAGPGLKEEDEEFPLQNSLNSFNDSLSRPAAMSSSSVAEEEEEEEEEEERGGNSNNSNNNINKQRAKAADIFGEEPPPPTSPESISRRLVEYFVMVSCIPIDDSVLLTTETKNNGDAKKSPIRRRTTIADTRPPNPNRDSMNPRTKGRFDVRRVHLSNSLTLPAEKEGKNEGKYDVAIDVDGEGGDNDESENENGGGGNYEDYDVGSTLLEPKITARYPPTDHADQPLNLRLPQFCHPEGTDLIHPTTEYKMPRVHHFVLTDSAGGKQYGTALTVFEEFKGKQQQQQSEIERVSSSGSSGAKWQKKMYFAPRVLVLLSTWPYLTAFRTYLTQLYRLATTTNVMTAPIERYVQNICSEVPAPPPGAFEVQLNILGSKIRFWAPPANQPIPYVSLPFKVLFECLDIGNILFAWYTLACEQKVLLVSGQLSLLTVCSEILNSLLFPMKWSHLYIPVLPRSLSPMLDAPMPYLCGISRENFPYAVEDISDETVVVDLDRNVITLGPNTPDLPPLPHNRRKKLEATLKANAGEVFWEARNLTKADVLKVRASGDEGSLGTMLDKAGAVWEEKIKTRDDAFNLAHAPDSVSLQFDEDANVCLDDGSLPKQSRWDAVQEAFLRFYVSLLQDYRKFLPEGIKMEERTSWRGKEGLSSLRFKTDEFVADAPSEFQPFLEELVLTQQFDDFITRKMHNAADAPDIKFFDQSIDAKRNRSKLKIKKKETPFLHSACAHRDLKRVQAVEPSGEGLPKQASGEGVYMYEMWPLSFDVKLFGAPRPIPTIISAEFDRRTALRSMLRSKYGIVDESRGLGARNRSPEVTTFILFFATFTSVIGMELLSLEEKHGAAPSGTAIFVQRGKLVRRHSLTNLDDDTEVARTIAKAQIDLGFHTLSLMRLRKLPPEPVVYKLLIQACGRTKVTHRASALMNMLARDGLATNSEIYTNLIAAFTNDDSQAPSSLALYHMYGDENMSSLSSSNHNQLDKRTVSSASSEQSSPSTELASEPISSGVNRRDRMKKAVTGRFSSRSGGVLKSSMKGKKKIGKPRLAKKHNLKLTTAIAKQIELGESLLESVYPGIDIDMEHACPNCATMLSEADIGMGWTPCASNDYQTVCHACSSKFVPKFSVSCKDASFEGSQGKGTPLYCDHLSPWVLLREIRSVIAATGVESILDVKFRKGSDISASLWWNMVVTFRRYKLPFIFLLQGSFQNQLILPSPSLNESSTGSVH